MWQLDGLTVRIVIGCRILSGAIVLGAAGCAPAEQAQRGATVTVANDLTLAVAIKTARPGTTILVEPGRYGVLDLKGRTFQGASLTIRAAKLERPMFAGADLSSARGLVLSGLGFTSKLRPIVQMMASNDILFAGNLVTGSDPDGDPWNDVNAGLHVRMARHVTIHGNRFEDLRTSVFVQRSERVVLSRNSIRHVREGFNIAATTDLSIDGNDFREFSPRFDRREHPDAIQFWTSNEKVGSSNVRIRDNVMLLGGCKPVQGIFIRSETEGRSDVHAQIRHQNFTIQRNLYYGSSKNGLSVSSVDDALVENNVIVASPYGLSGIKRADVTDPRCSGPFKTAILSRNGTESHRFIRNVATLLGKTDGASENNIALLGPGKRNWADVFVALPTDDMPDASEFLTRPGTKAHKRGIGLLRIAEHGAPDDPWLALETGRALHAEPEDR